MWRCTRIASLGLMIALLSARTARAEILITPFDTAQAALETQVQPGIQTEPETQAEPGIQTEPETQAQPGTQTEPGTQLQPEFQDQQTETSVPEISAEAGILYDVTHDRVLYEKNADEKLYPASITKLMTALLVLENAKLTDTVTYSKTAVTGLESGAVTLNLTEGDKLSVKDSLYGLLVRSANEVANGLAEHVGGSISGFADMMNQKAAQLGCTGTHFVNPNGLNSSDHYTTCRDMAKIAKAAFEKEEICKIASTLSYSFPATKKAAERTITPGHKMLYPSDSRYYPGIIGGKTGYTSRAGNTLVTCVEKDGVRMIAVILKSRNTHYSDTKIMLDYGFEVAGRVLTGWKKYGDNWYYYENGALVKNAWRQDADKWFYLGEDGAMMRNTWIDNTYYVGADGAWQL